MMIIDKLPFVIVDGNQICVVFFINFFFALKNAFDLEIRHDYDKEA